MVRQMGSGIVLAALAANTACYSYRTVPLTGIEAGTPVRARLTAVGVDRVQRSNAPEARLIKDFRLTGVVSRVTNDSVILGVEQSAMEANVRVRTTYTDLPLLRTELQQVELRTLNRRKSTVVGIALTAAAVVGVAIAIERGGRSTGTVPPQGGPADHVIPAWLRISR